MNEAFIIDGGVNYDVLVWPMERRLERKVLARVMSYEYLWHNIREVGGAYGTGMVTQNDGTEYLYTYRDPHLKESYETFAKGPAELAGRDYTEKDMNEFIVGAAAKLDTPRKPREEAASTDCKYFCGITDEMTAAERKSLCSVDAAALKAEAADLSARMEKGVRVVFGSKELWRPQRSCLTGWKPCKIRRESPGDFAQKLSERSPVCGKEHRQGIFTALKYYL